MNFHKGIWAIALSLCSLTACQDNRSRVDGSRRIEEGFTDDVREFLQHRVQVEKRDVGIVVGILDEHGSRIVSCGTVDNGTDEKVNGNTLFEIGSVTKTFTGVLLQDMVDRGQMNPNDPVAKYLPDSVKVPMYGGKQITLLDLATHTSGLPDEVDNLDPKRRDNLRADYSVEKLDAFVSGHRLKSEPGAKYEYSTVGIALLAQAIERKTGRDFESLLKKTHAAQFHAHLDTDSGVDTDIGMTWMVMHDTGDTTIVGHAGLTQGFTAFIGFDVARHRGVVVLCSSLDFDAASIGRILLEREWKSNLQATEMENGGERADEYVGQYRISPAHATSSLLRHGMAIGREGERLFVRITGPDTWPKHVLTPPVADELSPRSKDVFIERFSDVSLTFSRNARGQVTGFSGRYRGQPFSYDKISDQP
jgi:CubicO group peptidase (beta-lactamase class C family)